MFQRYIFQTTQSPLTTYVSGIVNYSIQEENKLGKAQSTANRKTI